MKLRQEDCPVELARPLIIENYRKWAGEMAQRVKVLVAKPDVSSIPGAHMIKGESRLLTMADACLPFKHRGEGTAQWYILLARTRSELQSPFGELEVGEVQHL